MSWFNAIVTIQLKDTGPIGWYNYLTVTEFFINDGYIYGNFAYLFKGLEIRALIWIFSILFVVLLSYSWAFYFSKKAKYARTISNYI